MNIRQRITGILTLICLLIIIPGLAEAPAGPYIQGKSDQYGWEIEVQGSLGTFKDGDETWKIELIYMGLGQDGFAYTPWFLGRKSDDYILLFPFIDTTGTNFYLWKFDYKKAEAVLDVFNGDYTISGMEAQPSRIAGGYIPVGEVPDYVGLDFRVSSPYARLSPAGGTVSYEELQLQVYPIYNAIISRWLSEFWAIGINSETNHTYHIIFYSDRVDSWVIDLSRGGVSLLPLGKAIITGGQVQVSHPVTLGGDQ